MFVLHDLIVFYSRPHTCMAFQKQLNKLGKLGRRLDEHTKGTPRKLEFIY